VGNYKKKRKGRDVNPARKEKRLDKTHDTPEVQARQSENQNQRKIGVELVRSADLSSRFYHGPSRRRVPILSDDDAWEYRIAKARAA